jgi:uncharacterized protein
MGRAPARGLCAKGQGVTQDYAAAGWYRKSADQGNKWAEAALADLYADGHGVSQDDTEAYFWYSLAADGLSADEGRDGVIAKRDAIATRLAPAQITAARQRVGDWHPAVATK